MKALIGVLLCIVFVLWIGVIVYNGVVFDKDCGGYLKRAADANTVDMAKGELEKALKYLQDNNMISGYTSILYKTPDEDVAFWYQNILASFNELKLVTEHTAQLEKTNILMKLRETLLDQNDGKSSITKPGGISLFPNNKAYAIFGWVSLVMFIVGIIFIKIWLDE